MVEGATLAASIAERHLDGTDSAIVCGTMATLLKILFFLVTIILPGGLVLIPLYYLIVKRRRPELDFSEQLRRVPIMRDGQRQLIVPRRLRA